MVGDREDARRIGDRASGFSQRVERRRAGALVQEDAVDRDQLRAAGEIGGDMAVPQPVEKAGRAGQVAASISASTDRQSLVTNVS